MKRLASLAFVAALLLGGLLLVNHRRQQTPAYILARYPKSLALERAYDVYVRPNRYTEKILLCESWFRHRKDTMATQCNVYNSGSRVCRSGTSFNALNSVASLTHTKRKDIEAVLQEMPLSQPPSDLNELLIMGYWHNRIWTVRFYDRSKLPPSVIKIHQILGIKGFDKSTK